MNSSLPVEGSVNQIPDIKMHCIAGLQSHAQTAATGRGRVGQVDAGQADEDPPRGGALQPR